MPVTSACAEATSIRIGKWTLTEAIPLTPTGRSTSTRSRSAEVATLVSPAGPKAKRGRLVGVLLTAESFTVLTGTSRLTAWDKSTAAGPLWTA